MSPLNMGCTISVELSIGEVVVCGLPHLDDGELAAYTSPCSFRTIPKLVGLHLWWPLSWSTTANGLRPVAHSLAYSLVYN